MFERKQGANSFLIKRKEMWGENKRKLIEIKFQTIRFINLIQGLAKIYYLIQVVNRLINQILLVSNTFSFSNTHPQLYLINKIFFPFFILGLFGKLDNSTAIFEWDFDYFRWFIMINLNILRTNKRTKVLLK